MLEIRRWALLKGMWWSIVNLTVFLLSLKLVYIDLNKWQVDGKWFQMVSVTWMSITWGGAVELVANGCTSCGLVFFGIQKTHRYMGLWDNMRLWCLLQKMICRVWVGFFMLFFHICVGALEAIEISYFFIEQNRATDRGWSCRWWTPRRSRGSSLINSLQSAWCGTSRCWWDSPAWRSRYSL